MSQTRDTLKGSTFLNSFNFFFGGRHSRDYATARRSNLWTDVHNASHSPWAWLNCWTHFGFRIIAGGSWKLLAFTLLWHIIFRSWASLEIPLLSFDQRSLYSSIYNGFLALHTYTTVSSHEEPFLSHSPNPHKIIRCIYLSNTPIRNGSSKRVTVSGMSPRCAINTNKQAKEVNNIPRYKIITPQTFLKVWRTTLDRRHVENWQTIAGRRVTNLHHFGDPLWKGDTGRQKDSSHLFSFFNFHSTLFGNIEDNKLLSFCTSMGTKLRSLN